MNAYALLGVRPSASPDEIRAAYRRRARTLHPDRHVQPDGTVPAAAHDAFCALNEALETALDRAERGVLPVQRSRVTDPVAVLLAVPELSRLHWPLDEHETWALAVVPAARARLEQARRVAHTAGPITGSDTVHATAHALLTLALGDIAGRGRLAPARIAAAYDVLEAKLPSTVLAGLPARVTRLPRRRLLRRR